MEKVLLLYNPKAGNGRVRMLLSDLIEGLSRRFAVEVYPTRKPMDAAEGIKIHPDFDILAIAGGDGMLHDGLNGLIYSGKQKPVFYLPTGTVNDFATTHHLSKKVNEALMNLDQPVSFLDVGLFNEEYFTYVAAFGLLTNVSYVTSQKDKRRLGILAYWRQSLREVDFIHWENNSFVVHVEYDGGEFKDDIIFGAISNTRYMAGLDFHKQEEEHLRDGQLEAVFVKRPMNLSELEQIIKALADHNYDSEFIYSLRSPWYRIHSDKNIDWTLDGEFGGSLKDAEIQAVSDQFSIYLPEKTHG